MMTSFLRGFLLACSLLAMPLEAQVPYMVKTAWHQNAPYNNLCPKGMLAGCVAIAMAQVMNYHQYPLHGIGKSTYTWKNKRLSADYGNTWYRWEDMDGEDVSVAQLVYHCGVSVWMDYSDYFSGSNEFYAKSALTDYFGYSEDIKLEARNKYTDEEWAALLKANLDKGWPIIYSSGGHTFVVDGYDASGLFHTNQGFGYVSEEYTYTVDRLGSKSTSTALVNIHPAENPKTMVAEPNLLIYMSDGTSRQFPYSDTDVFSFTDMELNVNTKGKAESLPLDKVSYFKAVVPK